MPLSLSPLTHLSLSLSPFSQTSQNPKSSNIKRNFIVVVLLLLLLYPLVSNSVQDSFFLVQRSYSLSYLSVFLYRYLCFFIFVSSLGFYSLSLSLDLVFFFPDLVLALVSNGVVDWEENQVTEQAASSSG